MLVKWLEQALRESGLSQSELAARLTQRLGRAIDRSAVNKMVNGRRKVSGDEMLAIGNITGVPAPEIRVQPIEIELPLDGLPVLGTIQAGAWLDTSLVDPAAEPEMLQVIPDARFPRARQYALRVVGDSMDLDYPDGSYVTCVDYAESGLSVREGMTVHVERHEADGQRVELTLKRVGSDKHGLILVPRSTNSSHKPIRPNGDDTVIIRGVVTGGWRRDPILSR